MTGMNQYPDPSSSTPLVLRIGHEELLVRRRYEALSIANDILVALWFAAGSVLFFWESTSTTGTWLFLVGSIELAVRPVIRLSRQLHLRRMHTGSPGESAQDF
ncbi:YrhK family protein [Actinopolyspora mortivallis]|uniref:YrhK family protein n=1 Tax=Actinopolyspora mortivallis TaxID=33906 RepID=UPI000372C464